MSGLFGLVDFAGSPVEPEVLRALAEAASYRAPAGIRYRCLGEAGLAHLARHAGDPDQPLFDPATQVCAVLDGRLDNRSELIAQLAPAEGAAVPDVRLLLEAYLRWGEAACTDHLLGDFAFALWDAGRRRLLCAVDPLGIKPLHFARAGTVLCFASDAAQVLAHPGVPDGYNEMEIAAYLGSQCEDPERSFFSAVRKLAPGQRLIADASGLRVERYWIPEPAEIRYARDEDYSDHFRELFQRAVSDRLRDAGSFAGVAMSGGLDSTSVAAVAQRTTGSKIRAYTFAFDQLPECDERSYSRAMTEGLSLEVEPIDAEGLWSLESQAAVPFSPDTPFFGWRTCYQEIFRRMAAQGSKVLLMGHGGDDLLRGSPLTYAERLRHGDLSAVREVVRHARSQRESPLRTFYRYFGRPYLPVGIDRLLRSALGIQSEVVLPPWIRPFFAGRTDLERRDRSLRLRKVFANSARQEVYENLSAVPWYWRLCNWHERSSAALGFEVRHPFLDRRLFEYVLAVPGKQLFRLGGSKSLLRRSMQDILPERIRLREGKTGFGSFLDFAMKERAAGEIQELLRAPRAAELEIVDAKSLRSAYFAFAHGKTDESRRALWYAISLEIWLRRCEVIRRDRRRVLMEQTAA